jgi:transcriptional regulator with XRE-family HTH domain
MENWGLRLRQALRSRRVRKLHALAVDIGVDQSAISRWRKGYAISLPNAIALSQALDVSLDWLMTGRGSMDDHRVIHDPIAHAARVFFGALSQPEALAVQRVLLALSDAATRHKDAPER